MKRQRPNYGNAFEYDRVLNVFFYTSNTEKLLQARLLFMRHGYELKHFRGKNEPYDENYQLGTTGLLTRAVNQVKAEFGVRSIFFVEDTSVRIDAFSGSEDFPGLGVKEWFPQTTFDAVDRELRRKGNNRRAKVNSDIAFYIPTLPAPLFFHGETSGEIADSPPGFDVSVQYPWLTPHTFNGWIIPHGSEKRLGEMEFEESLHYDFRAKALTDLLRTLEQLNAAVNLRPNFYTTRKSVSFGPEQLSLIEETPRHVILVVGAKCSGKTTFSDYMANYDSVRVYEASTVLRGIGQESGAIPSDSNEALAFLSEMGWDIVARKIAEYIEKDDSRLSVVTGLRTPEELLLLKRRFPAARIVLIDADSRIRFERHIRRARDGDFSTSKAFLNEDENQKKFGIMRIANDIAEIVITNDSGREQYCSKIRDAIDQITTTPRARRPNSANNLSELHRTLRALKKIGLSATCEEISKLTGKVGAPVRKYNTNRALKAVPEFAQRIEHKGEKLRYQLTSRSVSFLALLDLLAGTDTETDEAS
ncbi:non-canonical purine NTP pyrophosphatase [Bradyrhizobium sp. SZCCHNRI3043]|uniref:non-canonical purine NTP pyrophosphatase n=1 Tax=Bradyrhizobium sp. SZCCHNRI3043 TaxID=3057292 RepID=UPI0028E44502|nr:non-canonical purine NTP pyrophosphatase [Bradyrhizobium sp. SZCCHNRI3043]